MKTLPAITYATSGKQFRILDYTAQYNGAHAVNLLIIIRAVGSGQWAVADIIYIEVGLGTGAHACTRTRPPPVVLQLVDHTPASVF